MPELMTWSNPATGEEELVAYWIREVSIIYTNGVGQRVVHRRLSGGEWGPLANISEPRPDDPVDQMFPDIIEYKDHLYAIWVLGTNTTEYIEGNISRISTYGNIMLRIFNGYSWSQVWELTLMGNGFDNASYPTMSHFGDVLFAAWKATLRTSNDTLSWEEVVRPFDLVPVQANISFGGDGGATWGWRTITDGLVNATFDPEELTTALGTLPTYESDDWHNRFVRVPIEVSVDGRARVTIRNLTVLYDYTVKVDMTGDLRWAVNERRSNTPQEFMLSFPINLSSGSAGRMRLHDLDVEYHLDFPPVLVEPLPPLEVDEDSGGAFLTDMEEWFTDDWDDGRLAFDIIGRRGTNESFQAIDVYLDGSGLYLNPPPANWYGEMDVVVQAMDSMRYTNKTNYVTIRVLPVNDPPDLVPVPPRTLELDEEHRELLNASDVDDPRDSLRFSTDSDAVTVDPETGELRVTMRSDLPNPLVFNVTVTDPHGASDTEEVTYDYRPVRLTVTYWDWIPYALVLLLLLGLLLVVAERWRRHRRLTAEEVVWDEEAAYEERGQARSTGKWRRRSP
jgi:hypothetical protein